MKTIAKLAILACGLVVLQVQAQVAVPPPAVTYQPLAPQQLDQLLGPIALYPDPLMAEILPAATLPTQIVMADRYVNGGGDPSQIEQQAWDASVQALAHYPNVLKYLDDNLNWTEELGQAFLNQQQDVMDSVQRLRTEAQSAGNLQSTPQEQVVTDDGDIDIDPTDPNVIYVPVYQPDQVYFSPGVGITFGLGLPLGIWLNGDFDWHHHNVIVWDRDHPRPAGWWHEAPAQRNAAFANRAPAVWHPANRSGFAVNRGDRGWNNTPAARPVVNRPADLNRPEARPVEQSRPVEHTATPAPQVNRVEEHGFTQPSTLSPEINRARANQQPQVPQVSRPEPARPVAPAQNNQNFNKPAAEGAFIGADSARDTKAFSARGEESVGTSHPTPAQHSEPAARPAPAPASHSSSGGGSQKHY